MLNGPLLSFLVSGDGSYCDGDPGLPVNLSGTQAGIKYQLKKNGVSLGNEFTGDGNPVLWENMPFGIYKVKARRPATYQSAFMADSAVIIMDLATIGGAVTGGTTISLGSPTEILVLEGHLGSVLYWQRQVDAEGYQVIQNSSGLQNYQETPDETGTWNYRAVVQNGACEIENASATTVTVVTGPVARTWTGVIDDYWNKAGNWSPAGIPGPGDDVYIPSSAPHMPVVRINGLSCNQVYLSENATLIINPGMTLVIIGAD
jgi:hypothetical protein